MKEKKTKGNSCTAEQLWIDQREGPWLDLSCVCVRCSQSLEVQKFNQVRKKNERKMKRKGQKKEKRANKEVSK